MKHLIEIPLEDGSTIIVEVGDERSGAKGNAFIASADTEANFKVTLKSQRNK